MCIYIYMKVYFRIYFIQCIQYIYILFTISPPNTFSFSMCNITAFFYLQIQFRAIFMNLYTSERNNVLLVMLKLEP